jgi:hypothetical protein
VVNVTSCSIKICWEEPCNPNGNITGYILNVNASDGMQMNTTENEKRQTKNNDLQNIHIKNQG